MKKTFENNGIYAEKSADRKNSGKSDEYFAQEVFPGFGAMPVACRQCGTVFNREVSRKRGRPQAFCSVECRKASTTSRRNAWHQAAQENHPDRAGVICRACGETFTAPSFRQGRISAFCGDECRKAGRRAYKRDRSRRCLSGNGGG